MKTLRANGHTIDYTNDTAALIPAGTVVVLTAMAGIAIADIAPGETGALTTEEVHELPKDNTIAFALGARAFWNEANSNLVDTATGNTYMGRVWRAAETADETMLVKLNHER